MGDKSFSCGNGPGSGTGMNGSSGYGPDAETEADWQAGCFQGRPGHWWRY